MNSFFVSKLPAKGIVDVHLLGAGAHDGLKSLKANMPQGADSPIAVVGDIPRGRIGPINLNTYRPKISFLPILAEKFLLPISHDRTDESFHEKSSGSCDSKR